MILTESHVINFTMSGLELASYESILSILIFFTIFVFTRHLGNFGKNPKAFYRYRYTGSIVGDVSWILGLILVAELGIITSSILSLITMATTLIMGYFFLHDRPEKKDVVFAVFIVILICIGYIFKDVTL